MTAVLILFSLGGALMLLLWLVAEALIRCIEEEDSQ